VVTKGEEQGILVKDEDFEGFDSFGVALEP